MRFEYTPQGQPEQEILQVIAFTQDCCQTYYLNGSFLPPHDTVSLYADVWYYWQAAPPNRPGIDGYWMDKLAVYGSQYDENNQLINPLLLQLSISNNTNGHIISQFSVINSAIQVAATRLAGTNAILQDYILIGMPRSLQSNDYLRSLVYGSQRLPGRPANGPDDIIADINSQAGQTTIDIVAAITPRVNALQSAINAILATIDANQFTEYDPTLNSVLQTLNNYHDAKVANSVTTPTGSNVVVQSQQNVKVTYSTVFGAPPGVQPVTVTTPVPPGSAFGVTGGFIITPQIAFDVTTTVIYVGPVTVCFPVAINDQTAFASLAVYHSENGTLVDRTVSRDFTSRTVCAQTQSLSPFIVALKQSTGLAVTSSGFLFSRVTQTFNGTLTVKNTTAGSLPGPIQVVLMNLTPGVTLANATGTTGGNPFIMVPSVNSLAPGQSTSVNVQFKNPANVSITFTAIAHSGSF